MPILKLDKKGRQYHEGFDGPMGAGWLKEQAEGAWNAVTGTVTSYANQLEDYVNSLPKTAEQLASMAAAAAKTVATTAIVNTIGDASSKVVNGIVDNALNTAGGISSIAVDQAGQIVAEAKLLASIPTNPSNAADLIIQEALRQASLIAGVTAVISAPIEKVINATPIIKEVLPTAEKIVGTGASLVTEIPVVGEYLPVIGQTIEKIPIVGDIVEGSAKILTDVPIVGKLVAPILNITGFIKPEAQAQGPQIVEQINYVYEDAPAQGSNTSGGIVPQYSSNEHPIAKYFR